MQPLDASAEAPPIPGARLEGPTAVLFYKVSCATCQIVAPAPERLHRARSEGFVAVAQDPPEQVEEFARAYGTSFGAIPDTEPYEVSNAHGIRTVPPSSCSTARGWTASRSRGIGTAGIARPPVSGSWPASRSRPCRTRGTASRPCARGVRVAKPPLGSGRGGP